MNLCYEAVPGTMGFAVKLNNLNCCDYYKKRKEKSHGKKRGKDGSEPQWLHVKC